MVAISVLYWKMFVEKKIKSFYLLSMLNCTWHLFLLFLKKKNEKKENNENEQCNN